MTNNSAMLPRTLIIFGVCIPLACLVGYFLATPTNVVSFGVVGIVLLVLAIPLLFRWHYAGLIFAWNANLTLFFLPGDPSLWMLFAGGSLFLTVLASLMDKQITFQHVPSITWPVLFLTFVILLTAKLTGGIGLRSLGSGTYGGKKLFFVLAAIVGYFALSCRRIPGEKAGRYTGLFFLSGTTAMVSNLIYMAGPAFYFLFLFFPSDIAMSQAMEDLAGSVMDIRMGRLPGVTAAAMMAFYFILSRYGIQGTLQLKKPWRWLIVMACCALSLLGGFRSAVIIFALVLVVQFCFEGLFQARFILPLLLVLVLGGAALTVFVKKLPLSAQRSLSILPIEIDPAARLSADSSVEWRLEMWKLLLPQVRQYFFIGKGYAIDPTDLYMVDHAIRSGFAQGYEGAAVAGDYHSGPLSIMIPFGIFGMVGFIWLLIAGLLLLYRYHRFGNPDLQKINTFLLSYFVARAIFYFVGFGAFNSDMPLFMGILGLSIALNGGVRKEKPLPVSTELKPDLLGEAAPA